MFDSYLIEIDDCEAGLLLRDGETYVFHAVAPRYRGFEGARFADPWSAERALRRAGDRSTRRTENRRDGGDRPRAAVPQTRRSDRESA